MVLRFFRDRSLVFRLLFAASVVTFAAASLLIYFYIQYTQQLTKATKARAAEETVKGQVALDDDFGKLIGYANELAEALSVGDLKKDDIRDSIDVILKKTPFMYGLGVAYIPYANDPNIRTKSPYYVARSDLHRDRDEIVEIYSKPIYKVDSITNTVINTGRVFVDYKLSDIKDIMNNMNLGRSGYGFIIRRDGTFIAHPVEEYNQDGKTIFDVASEREDVPMRQLGDKAVKGERGIIEHSDEISGQSSWMFYEQVPSVGWSVVTVFIKDEIGFSVRYMRTQMVLISIIVVFFLGCFFFLLTQAYKYTTIRLWLFVVAFTFTLVAELLFIWNLALSISSTEELPNARKIVDRTQADNYKNDYNQRVKRLCNTEPVYIPTGLYIETIEFPSPNNVFLSGTVWQKYKIGEHDSIERGVIFPQSIGDVFTPAYNYTQGDEEVLGWYFRVTIRKNFTYQKYPFDRKSLSIRILPQDFKNYIVLTPELDSYKYTKPTLLPGLSAELRVPGWDLVYTNFMYLEKDYNTDFGIEGFGCRETTPEMFFDISLARNFFGTIFSGTMPIVVMLAILFILQTITTETMDTVTRVLGPTGSFFFAALLAHVGLRESLAVKDIVYFEYFYILLYMMILYVFLNSVLYSRPIKTSKLLLYKNNLIFKLGYWPTFLIVLITISIVVLLF